MPNLPNQEFLLSYLGASGPDQARIATHVILPFEVPLIESRISYIDHRKGEIAVERAAIAEQSGDSWHDGAFRESDREVLQVESEEKKLKDRLKSTVVEYPDVDEERVTLGSRVRLRNGIRDTNIVIVGFSAIHDKKASEAVPASLDAPVVQSVLGKLAGELALMRVGGAPREFEIVEIDQQVLRSNDERTRIS